MGAFFFYFSTANKVTERKQRRKNSLRTTFRKARYDGNRKKRVRPSELVTESQNFLIVIQIQKWIKLQKSETLKRTGNRGNGWWCIELHSRAKLRNSTGAQNFSSEKGSTLVSNFLREGFKRGRSRSGPSSELNEAEADIQTQTEGRTLSPEKCVLVQKSNNVETIRKTKSH